MSKRRGQGHVQRRKAWAPLRRGELNPELVAALAAAGDEKLPSGVWVNDTYEVIVRELENDWTHLSIKRRDRRVIREWRHLQAIKNEVCAPERWAFELFPPESILVDTANEYHLWVAPVGVEPPAVAGSRRAVATSAETNEGRVRGEHKARQKPWQPGLPTGEEPR